MKKIITILAIMLAMYVPSKAQLEQGNFLIGSDIARFRLGLDEGSVFNVDLRPKLAFFIQNNLALGAYLKFGLTTAKDAGTTIDYGIGALGRYYISDPSINVLRHSRFFLEGNVGIEGTNPAEGENTNGLGVGFGPGLAYFITPSVGLETLLKYEGIVGFGSRATSNNLVLSLGLQVYIPSSRVKARVEERPQ
jgi:hypothetical protein